MLKDQRTALFDRNMIKCKSDFGRREFWCSAWSERVIFRIGLHQKPGGSGRLSGFLTSWEDCQDMAENEQWPKRASLVPVSLTYGLVFYATKEAGSLKKMKGKMRKMVGDEKAGVCGSCLGSDMANWPPGAGRESDGRQGRIWRKKMKPRDKKLQSWRLRLCNGAMGAYCEQDEAMQSEYCTKKMRDCGRHQVKGRLWDLGGRKDEKHWCVLAWWWKCLRRQQRTEKKESSREGELIQVGPKDWPMWDQFNLNDNGPLHWSGFCQEKFYE